METRPPVALARSARRLLLGLLGAAVALPVLMFSYGTRQGKVVFVLYREPKLAAILILASVLLFALFWARRDLFQPRALLAALLRPPWRWLALWLTYGLTTVFWVAVPANLFYELSQYFLLLLLVLALNVWADHDPAVPAVVEQGLVLGLGAVTVVGLVQGVLPLAVLSPIDPASGVPNPSFLGYKNPMALALVGQIFFLLYWIRELGLADRRGRLLTALLAGELIYLASLKSRTSYLALLGAVLCAAILLIARERLSPRVVRVGLAGAAAAALFFVALAADAGSRSQVRSARSYLRHPASYLESDRGTYLLNSLQMVRHHPFGVGFGDWQTQYPVYRLFRRDLYFSAAVQVRKAHSDHIQTLAETGWPGFALWACFWISLLAIPVRGFLRGGGARSLLLAAQIAAFGIAMGTDYVTEHPYLKLEFLLVAFLAARGLRPAQTGEAAVRPARPSSWLAVTFTLVAAATLVYSVCLVRKTTLAADATERYVTAMEHRDRRHGRPRLDAIESALLREASHAGVKLAGTPGVTKGLSDDYRVLAQIEMLLGHRQRALAYARSSLHLHPYSPNSLWLVAHLLRHRRPAEAARWSEAADYIMNEATGGFAQPYPAAPY
jgi:O-antigen ligase